MKATLRRVPGYGRLRTIVRRIIDRPPPAPKWAAGGAPRILFVNGTHGPPMFYRVLNQLEQLALAGVAHVCYRDDDVRLARQIGRCDALYLCRIRDSQLMRQAIASAKGAGKPVIFDTDDLIWDQRLLDYCYIRERYPARDVQGFVDSFQQAEAMMRLADRFVASTDYLADALRAHFAQPVAVNLNAMSQHFVRASAPLFAQRRPKRPGQPVTIGYASGWPKAHEEDFAEALPAVLRVLGALPNARLRIMGHFELDELPGVPPGRVETIPFAPWEQMPQHLAGLDINLAPIVDNPHRRSKSAIKFLEAALVGVPTVASDLEPYRGIRHGVTGFLARDEATWYDGIMALAADPERCYAAGVAARTQVLAADTTERRAPAFARLLRNITMGASASSPL